MYVTQCFELFHVRPAKVVTLSRHDVVFRRSLCATCTNNLGFGHQRA